MNITRKIRCGVCGVRASEKRIEREQAATSLWTPSVPRPLRNFVRLPNGVERCASCTAKAVATMRPPRKRVRDGVSPRQRRRAQIAAMKKRLGVV